MWLKHQKENQAQACPCWSVCTTSDGPIVGRQDSTRGLCLSLSCHCSPSARWRLILQLRRHRFPLLQHRSPVPHWLGVARRRFLSWISAFVCSESLPRSCSWCVFFELLMSSFCFFQQLGMRLFLPPHLPVRSLLPVPFHFSSVDSLTAFPVSHPSLHH